MSSLLGAGGSFVCRMFRGMRGARRATHSPGTLCGIEHVGVEGVQSSAEYRTFSLFNDIPELNDFARDRVLNSGFAHNSLLADGMLIPGAVMHGSADYHSAESRIRSRDSQEC